MAQHKGVGNLLFSFPFTWEKAVKVQLCDTVRFDNRCDFADLHWKGSRSRAHREAGGSPEPGIDVCERCRWAALFRLRRAEELEAEKSRLCRLKGILVRSKASYQIAGRKNPASLKISLKPAVLLLSVFLPFSPANELTTLLQGNSSGGLEEICTRLKTKFQLPRQTRSATHARAQRERAPSGAAVPLPRPTLRRRPTTPRAPLPRWCCCCGRLPARAGCSSPSLCCGLRRPPPARTAGSRGAGGGGAQAAARCVGPGRAGGKGGEGKDGRLWAQRTPRRSCRRGSGPAVLCTASCCPVHHVRSLAERSKSVCASGGWLPCSLVSSGVPLGSVFWACGTWLRRASRAAPRAAVSLVWGQRAAELRAVLTWPWGWPEPFRLGAAAGWRPARDSRSETWP